MELTGYLRLLRRWWLTLLLATVTAGVVGYAVASQLPPAYESTTRLLVGPVTTNDFNDIRAAEQLTQTYAEIAVATGSLEAVLASVQLELSVEQLRDAVRARGNPVTRILSITAQMGSPELAASTANAVAGALMTLTDAPPGTPSALQVIDPAPLPGRPVAPQLLLIVALAALAGFAGSLVLVLVADYFSDLVRERSDIERQVNLPILAVVPVTGRFPSLDAERHGASSAAAYRSLAASMMTRRDRAGTVLVLGTDMSDGHDEVARHLALAAWRNGVSATYAPAESAGSPPADSAGSAPAGPGTSGRNQRASGTDHQVTVLSGAPVGDSAASMVWASRADAVLVVAARDRTRRSALRDTINRLRLLEANLEGVVLAERHNPLVLDRLRTVLGRTQESEIDDPYAPSWLAEDRARRDASRRRHG